jgi:hypothetical protein
VRVNRWLIFIIVTGLLLGFAGVVVHEPRAIGLGLLLVAAGLWAAVDFR